MLQDGGEEGESPAAETEAATFDEAFHPPWLDLSRQTFKGSHFTSRTAM